MFEKIKESLRTFAKNSLFGNLLFHFVRDFIAIFMLILNDRNYAKWFYKKYTGKKLNLDNPINFDEKLWWLKLNNHNSLLRRCSDKVNVREYVKEKGLENILIPIFGVYDHVKDIPFENIYEEVFLKVSNGSGENCLYNPNNKKMISSVKSHMRIGMTIKPFIYSREWNYKGLKNRIIIEKSIRDLEGNLPVDYKFLCFNGEPKLMYMFLNTCDEYGYRNCASDRFLNVYDMNFTLTPITEGFPIYNGYVPKPIFFETMKEYARILSSDFEHVRVDFLVADSKIYFGELTFYDSGGCNNIKPDNWNDEIGSWININSEKIHR